MEHPLRILVVLPLYGGSLPIGRYCASALTDLGHTVDVFEAPVFHDAHTALRGLRVAESRTEQLENAFINLLGQAIYARIERFEPDLVLALAQAPMSRQLLLRLRKEGIPSAMWFVEDYRIFSYWRVFAPLYDFFFFRRNRFFPCWKERVCPMPCISPWRPYPIFTGNWS